jgi:hypothetical protein
MRASGCRYAFVLTLEGELTLKLGPCEGPIKAVEWGPNGHLYIDQADHILTTSCDNDIQELLEVHPEPATVLRVSPKGSYLAMGVTSESNKVCCMSLRRNANTSLSLVNR